MRQLVEPRRIAAVTWFAAGGFEEVYRKFGFRKVKQIKTN